MATVKISELPAGQVVGNITVNGAQTFKSGVTNGAAAVGVVLDTVNALSTDTAKPLSIRTAGVEQAALERQSGAYWLSLGSTVIAGGSTPVVNASIQLNGAASKIAMGSSNSIQWTLAVADAFNTADTSIHRYAAGVVRFGDASTGIRGLQGGGTAVASATAMPLPTGSVFHVTGTTTITSITSTNFAAGCVITLIFDGALTFTAGNNLKIAGNFVTTALDTITLAYDGTNWHECSRSVNA